MWVAGSGFFLCCALKWPGLFTRLLTARLFVCRCPARTDSPAWATALHCYYGLRERCLGVESLEGAVAALAGVWGDWGQAVDAAQGFNRRVTEGKLAAKLIAKRAGLPHWASIQTMLDLEVVLRVWLQSLKIEDPSAL